MLKSTWFNILMLIIFPPFGIFTMFVFARWNIIIKIIIAIIMSSYTLMLLDFLRDFISQFA